ncbi:hypothetical protein [Marinovum sp.]|uniref:hypothetical protein n=1 Tax=Marinovum sp. TaxID=2024839 RepID=UPI003A926524
MHIPRHALRALFALILLSAPVRAGDLYLTGQDMVPVQSGVWAATGLELPEPDAALPLLGARNTRDGVRLLRLYNAQREVNGFADIVYDNRDRGHSRLDPELYPRLTHLKYGTDLAANGLDFGLAGRIFLPAVVLGNSSAAMERGAAPRSLPRLAMTSPFWRAVSPLLYANNHIYVYPEHRDHDATDRFPVNWPYMIASQGSSGSDQPFLHALALTLAALPRETFTFLRENGLVAPTLQMILRRNLAPVSTREDYLTGRAHPVVFGAGQLRAGQMVAQAADLRPDDVPPMVRLRVVEEDFSGSAGLAGLDERLLDTPAAIGRLWRSFAWERSLLVSAEDTIAPNDRSLRFEWRLLRGDPERVRIEPQGPGGRSARIHIAWHDPWTESAPGRKAPTERLMSRVDIGVFANNGVHDSAPSFISVDFPEHQIRQYATWTGGEKRLLSIDYDAEGRGAYFDPLLYWSAAWTDTAHYHKSGVISGWDRQDTEGDGTKFVAYEADAAATLYDIDTTNARIPTLRHVGQ